MLRKRMKKLIRENPRSKGCKKIVKTSLRRVIGLPVEAQVTSQCSIDQNIITQTSLAAKEPGKTSPAGWPCTLLELRFGEGLLLLKGR